MSTAFPNSLDTFPAPGTYLSSNPHSSLHTNNQDATAALEAKVGVDSSAVVTSLDYLVKNTSSVNPGHKHSLAAGVSDVTITSVANNDLLQYSSSSAKWINRNATAIPIKFGGTGADGAFTANTSTGAVNIDLGNAALVVKNYTTISITQTGSMTFTNPNTNGTTVVLKSQGAVTLTSSTAPMIDASGIGAAGGAGGIKLTGDDNTGLAGSTGSDGKSSLSFYKSNAGAGTTGAQGVTPGLGGVVGSFNAVPYVSQLLGKYPNAIPGSGGGGGTADKVTGTGSATGGTGGKGGGCLIIECAGAWNFTTTSGISIAGKVGADAVVVQGNNGAFAGGGGGGSGGTLLVFYNTLTANSGTVTTTGGTGGNNDIAPGGLAAAAGGGGGGSATTAGSDGTSSATDATKTGGDGAAGNSLIALNTEFA